MYCIIYIIFVFFWLESFESRDNLYNRVTQLSARYRIKLETFYVNRAARAGEEEEENRGDCITMFRVCIM